MEVTCRVGTFEGKFEGKTQVDIVEQICHFQEIFGEDTCGACKSNNLRFTQRTAQEYTFYEIRCLDCRARLALGTHQGKDGTMYPQRRKVSKDKDNKVVYGDYLPDNGWVKFVPEKKD